MYYFSFIKRKTITDTSMDLLTTKNIFMLLNAKRENP